MEGLEIQNLQKSFEDKAVLQGISFQQGKGEILALLGPSGSGKTTLLEIIAGLDNPDQGDCLWNGKSLLGIPPHLRSFGLMFQEYVLFPHKNVGENIAFGLKMARKDKDFTSSRVKVVLDLVGLSGFEERDINTLSGGEQQRIALARSLAPEPRLVMLDEPLGALDRNIRERLVRELRQILKKARQTALYVTHDQEEAFNIADRIVILGAGKAAQIGTPQEIYYQPNSVYIAQFLGMNNFLEGKATSNQAGSLLNSSLGSWQVKMKFEGNGTILIRPDRVNCKPDDNEKQISLTGKLLSSSFSGSALHLEVEINNEVIKILHIESDLDIPQPGEPIKIWFTPDESLQFFPAEN
ncbi:MAG: ABC transporter ATP-binding protein [Chloroflexi bacterium]|nr:ABC transporter ATP-binding protein [Chloroflexota bacterium]